MRTAEEVKISIITVLVNGESEKIKGILEEWADDITRAAAEIVTDDGESNQVMELRKQYKNL